MSTQYTTSESRLSSSRGPVANSARDSGVQFPVARSNTGPADQLVSVDPWTPSTCHFAPFDEHLNELVETPRWQKDLDDHFTNTFKEFVFSERSIDNMATRALQIIKSPTRAKICGLALAVYTHWMRMQFRCKDTNVFTPEIVTLISRITDHLGRMSVHARKDFLDELGCLCIEKLKLTWRWYVAVVIHGVFPVPRKNLFMRVMAAIAMISSLFHGGQLQYRVILHGFEYIAIMSPWPDSVAVIYGLLHKLGPRFALERAGWHFIQHLIADLSPLTVGRVHVDPLCQLVCLALLLS
ncbi:hypothetical protein HD554DRAFT_2170075 [Boletus coccyginus]|nr:hypothetical protein HD554DRAFT_2170075 [Boletus coccyginus]